MTDMRIDIERSTKGWLLREHFCRYHDITIIHGPFRWRWLARLMKRVLE